MDPSNYYSTKFDNFCINFEVLINLVTTKLIYGDNRQDINYDHQEYVAIQEGIYYGFNFSDWIYIYKELGRGC